MAGRRKRKRECQPVSASDLLQNSDGFCWSYIPGLKGVRWPVEVQGQIDDQYTRIYCHSDDACYRVRRDQLLPWKSHGSLEHIGIEFLKRRKQEATCSAFVKDLKWINDKSTTSSITGQTDNQGDVSDSREGQQINTACDSEPNEAIGNETCQKARKQLVSSHNNNSQENPQINTDSDSEPNENVCGDSEPNEAIGNETCQENPQINTDSDSEPNENVCGDSEPNEAVGKETCQENQQINTDSDSEPNENVCGDSEPNEAIGNETCQENPQINTDSDSEPNENVCGDSEPNEAVGKETCQENQQINTDSDSEPNENVCGDSEPNEAVGNETCQENPQINTDSDSEPNENVCGDSEPNEAVGKETCQENPQINTDSDSEPNENLCSDSEPIEAVGKETCHKNQQINTDSDIEPNENVCSDSEPNENVCSDSEPNENRCGDSEPNEADGIETCQENQQINTDSDSEPNENVCGDSEPNEAVGKETCQENPQINTDSDSEPNENVCSDSEPNENVCSDSEPNEADGNETCQEYEQIPASDHSDDDACSEVIDLTKFLSPSESSENADDTRDEDYFPPKKRKRSKRVHSSDESCIDSDDDLMPVPKKSYLNGNTKSQKGRINSVTVESISDEETHAEQCAINIMTKPAEASGLDTVITSQSSTDDQESLQTEFEKSIKEDEMLKDTEVPAIFVRKIQRSLTLKDGAVKKTNRIQNSYHACFYCKKMFQHIPTHFKNKHKDKTEVKEIASLQDTEVVFDQKIAQLKQSIMRAKGDHIHNLKVVKQQKGELLFFRRPQGEFDHKDFGPCPSCMEWILLTSIPKHQKTCNARKYEKELGANPPLVRKRELLIQTEVLLENIALKPSKTMVNEVYTSMKTDNIAKLAKTDPLIVALGESWLRKSYDNKLKRKSFTSSHMRHCGKLLEELRKLDLKEPEEDDKQIWDFLRPSHFDKLVEASLQTALPDIDDLEELKSPSNAIKIKYDLLRMLMCKIAVSVREADKCKGEEKKKWEQSKKEGEECKFLLDSEWAEKVTKLATSILRERKMGTVVKLPNPEDIAKLNQFLGDEIKDLDLQREQATWDKFKRTSQLTESKLAVYNRRRAGEIEAMELRHYMRERTVEDVDRALMGELSELDRYLLESQTLIETRGKCGRIVPVLIPNLLVPALDFLASAHVRKKVGITEGNDFLFANRGSFGILRVYDALQMTSREAQVQSPERITTVNMRKYTATLSQVMDLNENQLDWVCRHLGHTKAVHLQNYRQTSPFIERVHIGKLLLMQSLNVQNRFIGKKIEEIDFMDILRSEGVLNQTSSQEQIAEPADGQGADRQSRTEYPQSSNEEGAEQLSEKCKATQGNDRVSERSEKCKATKGNSRVSERSEKCKAAQGNGRQPWTEKELAEIKNYFKKNFDMLKTPNQREVLKAKEKSKADGGLLHHRHWHTIVKKMSALIQKIKRQTDF